MDPHKGGHMNPGGQGAATGSRVPIPRHTRTKGGGGTQASSQVLQQGTLECKQLKLIDSRTRAMVRENGTDYRYCNGRRLYGFRLPLACSHV